VGEKSVVEKVLALEFLGVAELAALAAARWMGQANNDRADQAAVEAMRRALEGVDIAGTVVIGEGERDEAPMLYIGERVGSGRGPEIDIAVDPVEGTNLVARGQPNALSVIAASERGGLLHAPDTYMDKLIVGPPAADKVSLDYPVRANLQIIADALNRRVSDLTVIVLDRPRHQELIEDVREAGARIKLISDGDISAAISVAVSGTGVHAVMGIGGAPEGVLAAVALRCLGGAIFGRLKPRNDAEAERARSMGIDLDRVYTTADLAKGENLIFAATGITDGELFKGVHYFGGGARTHSLVMTYRSGTMRFIDTVHIVERRAVGVVRL
jgi:fructose-1,6-bisphosphatase II